MTALEAEELRQDCLTQDKVDYDHEMNMRIDEEYAKEQYIEEIELAIEILNCVCNKLENYGWSFEPKDLV